MNLKRYKKGSKNSSPRRPSTPWSRLKETIGHRLDGRALCRIECFRTGPLNLTSLFDWLLIDLIPIGLHSWGCWISFSAILFFFFIVSSVINCRLWKTAGYSVNRNYHLTIHLPIPITNAPSPEFQDVLILSWGPIQILTLKSIVSVEPCQRDRDQRVGKS